jgi:hypothetical protein
VQHYVKTTRKQSRQDESNNRIILDLRGVPFVVRVSSDALQHCPLSLILDALTGSDFLANSRNSHKTPAASFFGIVVRLRGEDQSLAMLCVVCAEVVSAPYNHVLADFHQIIEVSSTLRPKHVSLVVRRAHEGGDRQPLEEPQYVAAWRICMKHTPVPSDEHLTPRHTILFARVVIQRDTLPRRCTCRLQVAAAEILQRLLRHLAVAREGLA